MKSANTFFYVLFFWGLSLTLFSCQNASSPDAVTHLGEVHFEVTGSPEAMPHFERGLLLLHSFEYADARDAFLQAQQADPDFVMAYWGEAMTHHHPLWRQQAYAKGQEALNKLAPTPAERLGKASTELERDFVQAVDILYGEGDKYERDQAYAEWMGRLYEKYAGDHEVAAFYALSLLGSVPVGRDDEVYGQAARIAEGILAENPNHPGALHYMIHSYDDPDHAHKAKPAADSYAVVAPDAAHALHMPSHIYVALGMWREVVASNVDSYEASVKRMARKELDNNARSYHAFHWLLYGYLQQEKKAEALRIMQDMQRYTEELPSRSARSYLINMKGNYLVDTDDWSSEVAAYQVAETEDLNIVDRAAAHFLDGMLAYKAGDGERLQAILTQMDKERANAALLVSDTGVPMCSSAGANRSAPNQLDIDQAYVMELELLALAAELAGETAQAEAWLQQACRKEGDISYSYGPPAIVYPSYELYADWLLDHERPAEALQQYDKALYKGPRRAKALRGKLAAARKIQDEETIREVEGILAEIQAKAAMDPSAQSLSLR